MNGPTSLSLMARRIAGVLGGYAGELEAQVGGLGRRAGRFVQTMAKEDRPGGTSAWPPTIRELRSHNKKEALVLLRAGLNRHYGRSDHNGRRLFLSIDGAAGCWRQTGGRWRTPSGTIVTRFRFEGIARDHTDRAVGRVRLWFNESAEGTLVVKVRWVELDAEDTRAQALPADLLQDLRAYFRRSGVDHVKITMDTTRGGRGLADICDWDPDYTAENRRFMLARIHEIRGTLDVEDQKIVRLLTRDISGDASRWPVPAHMFNTPPGEAIMDGLSLHAKYRPK